MHLCIKGYIRQGKIKLNSYSNTVTHWNVSNFRRQNVGEVDTVDLIHNRRIS